MDTNKFQFLGIVRRANALIWGARLMEGIRKKEVFLVLISEDASERTQKQLKDKCAFYQIPFIEGIKASELESYSDQVVVSFGITNAQMAQKLLNEMR